MDFINRLRQKSPAVKTQIAVATSAVVTLAIFGLWMSVLNFGNSTQNTNTTAAVSNVIGTDDVASGNDNSTDVNPFYAFWAVLSQGWSGMTESITQMKSNVGSQLQGVVNMSATSSASLQQSGQQSAQETPQPNSQKDVLILTGDSSNTTQ